VLLTPASAQIRQENLRVDLAFLSSEALEGRRSLGPGSDAAIQFIVAEFTRAGLKPANGASYLPAGAAGGISRRSAGNALDHRARRDRKAYSYLTDFIGGLRTKLRRARRLCLRVMHYRRNLTTTNYAGIDARGKIVLVFDHEPQENGSKIDLQRNRQHAAC